jgi:hypothetical protein
LFVSLAALKAAIAWNRPRRGLRQETAAALLGFRAAASSRVMAGALTAAYRPSLFKAARRPAAEVAAPGDSAGGEASLFIWSMRYPDFLPNSSGRW